MILYFAIVAVVCIILFFVMCTLQDNSMNNETATGGIRRLGCKYRSSSTVVFDDVQHRLNTARTKRREGIARESYYYDKGHTGIGCR